MRALLTIVLAAAFLVSAPLVAWGDPPRTAITGVTVVDVERGALVPDRTVVIEGERIVAIEDRATARLPEGTSVVAGEGLFLIPGLFDSHVHLFDPATFGPLLVANGVTAARDMGGFVDAVLGNREKFRSGEIVGPELFVTGPLLDGSPPTWPVTEICDTPEAGRAAVASLVSRGVDQIKVYSRLSKETYHAICAEAAKNGKKPVGHIPEAITLRESLAAGQASNEHLLSFGAEIARLAGEAPAEKHRGLSGFADWAHYPKADRAKLAELLSEVRAAGQHQCPTLVVLDRLGRMDDPAVTGDPLLRYVPAFVRDLWQVDVYRSLGHLKLVVPMMKAFLGDLHAAGVPILAGTDLGNPYLVAGHSLHDEILFLSESGLGAAGALRAATIVPAKFLGVEDRLGSVAVGKIASLALVRGNPLEDVRHARAIEGVFLRGRHFARRDLDAMLAGVESAVAAANRPPAAAAAAADDAPLSLPGEVVAKGRYRVKFRGNDAGYEDFLVTRVDGGYLVGSRSEPSGGFDQPSSTTLRLDERRRLVSATHGKAGGAPIEARYFVEGDTFRAEATAAGDALPGKTLPIPKDALLGGPSYAASFATLFQTGLSPGETRTYRSLAFGFPSWEPSDTKCVVERRADESVKRGDGSEVNARLYATDLETSMGLFEMTTWVDDRGVPLRFEIAFAFGRLEVVLE